MDKDGIDVPEGLSGMCNTLLTRVKTWLRTRNPESVLLATEQAMSRGDVSEARRFLSAVRPAGQGVEDRRAHLELRLTHLEAQRALVEGNHEQALAAFGRAAALVGAPVEHGVLPLVCWAVNQRSDDLRLIPFLRGAAAISPRPALPDSKVTWQDVVEHTALLLRRNQVVSERDDPLLREARDGLLARSRVAARKARWQQVLELAEQALTITPDDPVSIELAAEADYRLGSVTKAADRLLAASIVNGSPNMRLRAAVVLMKADRAAQALLVLEHLPIEECSQPALAARLLLQAALQAGGAKRALAVIARRGDQPLFREMAGPLQLAVGEAPRVPLQDVSQLDSLAAFARGLVEFHGRHWSEAAHAFSLVSAPDLVRRAWFLGASARIYQGDDNRALDLTKHLARLPAHKAEVACLKGHLAARQGHYADALQYFGELDSPPKAGPFTEWIQAVHTARLLRLYHGGYYYSDIIVQADRRPDLLKGLPERIVAHAAMYYAVRALEQQDVGEARRQLQRLAPVAQDLRVAVIRSLIDYLEGHLAAPPQIESSDPDITAMCLLLKAMAFLEHGDGLGATAVLQELAKGERQRTAVLALLAQAWTLQTNWHLAYVTARLSKCQPQVQAGAGLMLGLILPTQSDHVRLLVPAAEVWAAHWLRADRQAAEKLLATLSERGQPKEPWVKALLRWLLVQPVEEQTHGDDLLSLAHQVYSPNPMASGPLWLEAMNARAVTHLTKGEPQMAVSLLMQCLRFRKEQVPEGLLINLAIAQAEAADKPGAATTWERLLRMWGKTATGVPEDYWGQRMVLAACIGTNMALASEKWRLAARLAQYGLTVDPVNMELVRMRQVALCESGKVGEGLALLEKVARELPDPVPILGHRAKAIWNYQGPREGIAALMDLRSQYPEHPSIRKNVTDAVILLSTWAQQAVDDARANVGDGGDTAETLKNWRSAYGILSDALELTRDTPEAVDLYAQRALVLCEMATLLRSPDAAAEAENDTNHAKRLAPGGLQADRLDGLWWHARELQVRILADVLSDDYQTANEVFIQLTDNMAESDRLSVDTEQFHQALTSLLEEFRRIRKAAARGRTLAEGRDLPNLPFVSVIKRCNKVLKTIRDLRELD